MCKRYKIILTEEQMRVVQKCTEFYFRIMLGQAMDLADELAFFGVDLSDKNIKDKVFDKCIVKKDMLYHILNGVFRAAFDNGFGTPEAKSEDMMIAECIWDAIQFARGQSRWDRVLQTGPEPVPKIEVIEDE